MTIGGGSAGFAARIKGVELGKRVALVKAGTIGGYGPFSASRELSTLDSGCILPGVNAGLVPREGDLQRNPARLALWNFPIGLGRVCSYPTDHTTWL
jgi:hypothetical protein